MLDDWLECLRLHSTIVIASKFYKFRFTSILVITYCKTIACTTMVSATQLMPFFFLSPISLSRNTKLGLHYSQVSNSWFTLNNTAVHRCTAAHTIDVCAWILKLACTYCNRKQQNGVGMALNEATLPLILYRKAKTSEHAIVRTSCHISIPCFITFLASAIPIYSFFHFNVFFLLVQSMECPVYRIQAFRERISQHLV